MHRSRAISALGVALLTLALGHVSSAVAQDKAAEPAMQEGQIDASIRNFILRNPQVIKDALANAAATEELERTKRILREKSDAIHRADSPTLGAPDAKISIVEFFDYNCPYCRKSYPILKQFISQNPDVRVIFKDIANLGKESEAVARLATAARRQYKFQPFHDALMERQGRTTEGAAVEVARKLGLNIDLLKKDAASAETAQTLATTRSLASGLSVEGTPLFIIGHSGIAGAPDDLVAQITKYVEQIRKSGCDVC